MATSYVLSTGLVVETLPGTCTIRYYVTSEAVLDGVGMAIDSAAPTQVKVADVVPPAPQADARVIGLTMNKADAGQPVAVCTAGLLRIRPIGFPLFSPAPVILYAGVIAGSGYDTITLGHWVSWLGWAYGPLDFMVMPGYSDIQQSA